MHGKVSQRDANGAQIYLNLMNKQSTLLTIMVALNCEAKPWIDFYGLKKSVDKPFSLYSKDGVNVEIVITGIGALAMSTAVGWVAGLSNSAAYENSQRVWLNIGIAGHERRDIGEAVRVHAYIDGVDLHHYYSPLPAKWGGDSDALMSVNAPSSDYPDEALVDMEGTAFYRAACMFSSAELVESIKVISDNKDNSVEALNASKISDLMRSQVSKVNQFTSDLLTLVSHNDQQPINIDLAGIRTTHSQRQQLKALLDKANVLGLHDAVADLSLSSITEITPLLTKLSTLIDNTAPALGDSESGVGHS